MFFLELLFLWELFLFELVILLVDVCRNCGILCWLLSKKEWKCLGSIWINWLDQELSGTVDIFLVLRRICGISYVFVYVFYCFVSSCVIVYLRLTDFAWCVQYALVFVTVLRGGRAIICALTTTNISIYLRYHYTHLLHSVHLSEYKHIASLHVACKYFLNYYWTDWKEIWHILWASKIRWQV